jgi:hypothetical protein
MQRAADNLWFSKLEGDVSLQYRPWRCSKIKHQGV